MNTRTKTLGLMTMAALVALPGLSDTVQGQQGPVRQGLRGAAEISGQAVRRTGEAILEETQEAKRCVLEDEG